MRKSLKLEKMIVLLVLLVVQRFMLLIRLLGVLPKRTFSAHFDKSKRVEIRFEKTGNGEASLKFLMHVFESSPSCTQREIMIHYYSLMFNGIMQWREFKMHLDAIMHSLFA
jgi:hypothetical protein